MIDRENAPTLRRRQGNAEPFLLRSFVNDDTHTLVDGVVVGRELDCGVRLQFTKVSRYHAKFIVLNADLYLEDLRSSNGTFVNGQRIVARTLVSLGDEVAFGDQRYRLTTKNMGNSAATQLFIPSQDASASVNNAPVHQAPLSPSPSPASAAPTPPFSVAPAENLEPVYGESFATPAAHQGDDALTRLYSPDQILSIAQRNLEHYADLDVGSGPRFIVLTAPLRGKVYPVGLPDAGRAVTIGRDERCDLRIAEASISRQHARILYVDKQFHIDATHASNRLLINGENQAPNAILRHGDKVQFGRVEAIFRTDVKRAAPIQVDEFEAAQGHQKLWLMAAAVVTLVIIGGVFWWV
ncbi:MAG: FHA domain-containing protein [Marinagarivorans sp.]|nr:FHA domain-containing protein [Marinagarivorans sp.]